MSDEVIKTFNLSSNSYSINVNINPTVKLDLNKYNYYFSLDTISFSKVNCNIYGDEVLHVKLQINTNTSEFRIKIPAGVYDTNDISNWIKSVSDNHLSLEVDQNNGRASIKAQNLNENDNITIFPDSTLLTGKILNFVMLGSVILTNVNNKFTSPKTVLIEDFNQYFVTTNLISPCCYTNNEKSNQALLTNILTVIPSNANPFEFKTYYAYNNLEYKIELDVIDYIEIKILAEGFKELVQMKDVTTDFSVCFRIIKKPKM